MKDEVKNAILNKNSLLIYGYDHGYNIDIFNQLAEGLEAKHNEIFYFDAMDYSSKPKFKQEYHRVSQELDLFEVFKEKDISQRYFDRYIKDICNCLHSMLFDTKVDGQIYLSSLLEDVYHSEYASAFDLDKLIELLGEIINTSKSRIGANFFKTLDEIDSLKSKHTEDYFADSNFDKLAKKARLQLENYLLQNSSNRKFSEVALKWSNNDLAVKYFTKLLDRMNIPRLYKFSNVTKTVPGKINYFQMDRYTTRCNYVDIFLSNLVRKLNIYKSANKPLIIINGTQKDLFKSVSMDVEELFQKCDVCYIINRDEDLDLRINHFMDVKVYTNQHKNLSVRNNGSDIKIEHGYSVSY